MDVVNGFQTYSASDREYAKQGVDPRRPQEGPNQRRVKREAEDDARDVDSAVKFGAQLAQAQEAARAKAEQQERPAPPRADKEREVGRVLDMSA